MNTSVRDAFSSAGNRIWYEYDFGSTTELVVSLSGHVEVALGQPVRAVARNEPPVWPCDVCGQAATEVCTQCLYDGRSFCCAKHAASHDCGDEMLLPVVNSQRMGICGYTGEG